jgi:hypothetical protein
LAESHGEHRSQGGCRQNERRNWTILEGITQGGADASTDCDSHKRFADA